MIDVLLFSFLCVMILWIVVLMHNWYEHREMVNAWTDLFDEDDRDCIG